MGPKFLNCCKLEQMGTKEFGKMMKRVQTVEEGRVPAKEAKNWRIEGHQKRITTKEFQRLSNNFEMDGLMAQKGLWEGKRRVALIGNVWNRSPFLSPKSVHFVVQARKRRRGTKAHKRKRLR